MKNIVHVFYEARRALLRERLRLNGPEYLFLILLLAFALLAGGYLGYGLTTGQCTVEWWHGKYHLHCWGQH